MVIKMVKNSNQITGKAMSVLAGVICLIAPWFTSIGFFSKAGISIIGIFLIVLGTR